jgi:hypothetical protein
MTRLSRRASRCFMVLAAVALSGVPQPRARATGTSSRFHWCSTRRLRNADPRLLPTVPIRSVLGGASAATLVSASWLTRRGSSVD